MDTQPNETESQLILRLNLIKGIDVNHINQKFYSFKKKVMKLYKILSCQIGSEEENT